MKKLTLLSVVVASLLLVGCNEDKSVESNTTAVKTEVATETQKVEAPKAEEAKAETISEKATKAMDSVKSTASVAMAKTAEVATDAKAVVTEKATAVIESSKEVAHDAKEAVEKKVAEVKEVVAEKVAEAKDAVAQKTEVPASYAACAGCHGKDGKLKALGKSAIIAGQAKADLITKLNGYKAGTLNTNGMGSLMKGQAEKLSDADIEAIATYISGI